MTIAELPPEGLVVVGGQLAEPLRLKVGGGQAALFSRRSPDKETANEDAAAVLPLAGGGAVLAVADGCGGHAAGEEASKRAVETLRRHVAGADPDRARAAVLDAFEEANRDLIEGRIGSASTLAVALIQDGTVRPFHAGDTTVLVTGSRGKLKLATLAHAPVAYAVEAGLLDEDEALHHGDRSVIANLVGAADMRIELGPPIPLALRDTLLLASDGLTDNLTTEELLKLARRGRIEEAASALASAAHERMTRPKVGEPSHADDCTFVLFRRA